MFVWKLVRIDNLLEILVNGVVVVYFTLVFILVML